MLLHLRNPIVITDQRGAKRKLAPMMHKRRQCLFAQEPIGKLHEATNRKLANLLCVGWKWQPPRFDWHGFGCICSSQLALAR